MHAIRPSSLWIRTYLILVVLGLASAPPAVRAQQAEANPSVETTVPGIEGEFFSDLSGKISKRDGVDISRTLRVAAENSRIQPMLVVINKMSDYPTMPQEINTFATKLAQDWKIGDIDTKKGVLVIFSLVDHKYGVVKTPSLPQSITDSIKQGFRGRTLQELKEGRLTLAMKMAAEAVALNLPKGSAAHAAGVPGATADNGGTKTVTRTTRTRQSMGGPFAPVHSSGSSIQPNSSAHSGGFGFGWIAVLVAGVIFLFVVMAVISMVSGGSHGYGPGMGGGYFGGGYGGGGGFLSGMLTGGLLGYMFSGSHWGSGWGGNAYGADSNQFTDTTTTETFGGGGGISDAGGGGYDSFGGGDFDGGGSFGDW